MSRRISSGQAATGGPPILARIARQLCDRYPAFVIVATEVPSRQPGSRVVPVEDQARRTIKKQIEQLVQLDEGHAFTYDRETLIKMLDEALAGSRPRVQ